MSGQFGSVCHTLRMLGRGVLHDSAYLYVVIFTITHGYGWVLIYWKSDGVFCVDREKPIICCAKIEKSRKRRKAEHFELGFLKLRSPRGQLLAYLCTYLLLSLKR